MRRWDYFFLYVIALVFFGLCSLWIKSPGYMDAEYYTLSAIQMAEGKGMTQPIIWNYLDDPSGIPHPSHTYWMPAPSILALSGMLVTGKPDFNSGRLFFILIAALAAPAAAWMGFRFNQNRLSGWLAAIFAVFCGFYAPYSSTIDSFFLMMPSAWLIFYGIDRAYVSAYPLRWRGWFLVGLACGWMHLNRADGFLWVILAVGVWLSFFRIFREWKIKDLTGILLLMGGYLLVMGFWFVRNFSLYGSPFIPHTIRALWVTQYNEIFSYPSDILTVFHWLSSGWSVILSDRFGALGYNLVIMIAVQGMIFLFPFWIYSVWKHRRNPIVIAGTGMELAILLIMSFVFPYTGRQGGFLHSTAALQPLIWGLAAAGIMDALTLLSKRSGWNVYRTIKMYVPGIALLSLVVTIFIFQMLVLGNTPEKPAWEESYRRSNISAKLLTENNVPDTARVMINNPAGFWLASRREAVVIPDGPPETSLTVAKKYNILYMILEKQLVTGLFPLYRSPNAFPGFELVDRMEDQLLFRLYPEKAGLK